jgi:hypothetical protein
MMKRKRQNNQNITGSFSLVVNYGTTEESLKACFEKWGEIVDVAVVKDPKTNKYVLFAAQMKLRIVGSTCSQSWENLTCLSQ